MRKLLHLLLLLTFAIHVEAAKPAPLYIVDGEFVSHKKVPKENNIARISVLDSEEAVYIYGEKASGGAVVIKTINHEEYIKDEQEAETRVLIFLLIASCVLPYLSLKLISRCKDRLIAEGVIAKKIYSPGPFSDDGVRYQASSFVKYYIPLLLLGILVGILIWVLTFIYEGTLEEGLGTTVFVYVVMIACAITFLLLMYPMYKLRENHIIIDKQGIRGTYNDVASKRIMPEFIRFNIDWRNIAYAKISQYQHGNAVIDYLDIYNTLETVNPTQIIYLNTFSTNKIIDAINYYHALYKGEKLSEDSLMIQPQKIEDNYLMTILISMLTCAITIVLFLLLR